MKTTIEFFTSETFGFLLKLFSGLAAAAFGMLGIGSKTREDDGRLTRNGKIALTGIIVAGLLAIGTSIYDFTTASRKARAESLKSERLLLSVQRGIYPLKNVSGNVRINFNKDFKGSAEYTAMLRTKLPSTNGKCGGGKDYYCYVSQENNDQTYGIAQTSPLFPKKGSILEIILRHLAIEVNLIQPKPTPENKNFKKLGSFSFEFAQVAPKNVSIAFDAATGLLQYEIRDFRIPDAIVGQAGVYSLVEVFPGFISTSPSFYEPLLCNALKSMSEPECMAAAAGVFDAMQLDDLTLNFDYPKAVRFTRNDPRDIVCPSQFGNGAVVLMLPDDIDQVDEQGDFRVLTHPEPFKDSICATLADPDF